jgi:hypothetical protein
MKCNAIYMAIQRPKVETRRPPADVVDEIITLLTTTDKCATTKV